MTFNQIYTECTNLRFNTQAIKLAQVKNWVNQAEIAVWNAADWNFKRMGIQTGTLTVISNLARYDISALASKGSKVHAVYDSLGNKLTYMLPDDWESVYAVGTIPTGLPEAWTIIDNATNPPVHRAVYVGPASQAQITLSIRRRYYHLDNGGNLVAGFMSADTDTPCWDPEFHYILVPIAIRLGKILEDDPTASLTEQAILGLGDMSMLAAMKDELVGTVEGPTQFWGVDTTSEYALW